MPWWRLPRGGSCWRALLAAGATVDIAYLCLSLRSAGTPAFLSHSDWFSTRRFDLLEHLRGPRRLSHRCNIVIPAVILHTYRVLEDRAACFSLIWYTNINGVRCFLHMVTILLLIVQNYMDWDDFQYFSIQVDEWRYFIMCHSVCNAFQCSRNLPHVGICDHLQSFYASMIVTYWFVQQYCGYFW